jgi:hypothetical protein
MKVQELIDRLKAFRPDAEVRLGVRWPDRVTETYEQIVVEDNAGSPMLRAAMDLRGVRVYVGSALVESLPQQSRPALDLGQYDTPELAAKVRDFYVIHKGLGEQLNFPHFDYRRWIPPRTTSGQYNPLIADILREQLLGE